jgi:hypothetical protein
VGNVVADYILKSTTISQTSACKLSFYSAKLRIKGNNQVDKVIMPVKASTNTATIRSGTEMQFLISQEEMYWQSDD